MCQDYIYGKGCTRVLGRKHYWRRENKANKGIITRWYVKIKWSPFVMNLDIQNMIIKSHICWNSFCKRANSNITSCYIHSLGMTSPAPNTSRLGYVFQLLPSDVPADCPHGRQRLVARIILVHSILVRVPGHRLNAKTVFLTFITWIPILVRRHRCIETVCRKSDQLGDFRLLRQRE